MEVMEVVLLEVGMYISFPVGKLIVENGINECFALAKMKVVDEVKAKNVKYRKKERFVTS